MVYFRLAVKRPNSIKIHDNTVTTKDMYIQNKVFTKFHVQAIDTIADCHSIVFSQPSIYIDGWLYGMRMTSVVCNVPVLSQNDST